MINRDYEVVIGLEVHAELCTETKIFCGCKNAFGAEVNTLCCPVCMGMPGTLPVLNKQVVDYAIKMGHALNCSINRVSKNDRKNYFYPDLPKAYQISQFDVPLCENGYLDILVNGDVRRIGITRIHIEEDAGKLIHDDSFDGTWRITTAAACRSLRWFPSRTCEVRRKQRRTWKPLQTSCFISASQTPRCRRAVCAQT